MSISNRFRPGSLRGKLSTAASAATVLTLLLAAGAFLVSDYFALRNRAAAELTTLTEVLARNISASISLQDAETAQKILSTVSADTNIRAATVFAADGDVLATYPQGSASTQNGITLPGEGHAFKSGRLVVQKTIRAGVEKIGRIHLESDLSGVHGTLQRQIVVVGSILLLSIILSQILSSRIQAWVFAPIEDLARGVKDFGGGKPKTRLEVTGDDEIAKLAGGFNQMIEDLSASAVSTAYLDTILMSMADSLIVADLDGTITHVNPATSEMTGYKEEELIGINLTRIVAEEDGTPFDLNQVVEKEMGLGAGKARGIVTITDVDEKPEAMPEKIYVMKDTTHLAVSLSTRIMKGEDGHTRGVVCVGQDITSRKRAEADWERARSAALESAAAKAAFLANMSHEIRTPLNGVIGITDLLMETDLGSEQMGFAEVIKSSGESLLSLVNDILDYSKIEAGKLELENLPFQLDYCIAQTLKPLALKSMEKGLEIVFRCDEDVPGSVEGDPSRLRQVIVNLVGNAIKFTESGEIVVEVSVDRWYEGGVWLHFTVSDTGIGIPSEARSRLFDPFTQADGSMTRKYGGTGLGLSISSQLVSLMGGIIWVESEPGKGSKFHFTSNFGLSSVPQQTDVNIDAEQIRRLYILVVDTNPEPRRFVEKTLKSWDIRCSVVDSLDAALTSLTLAKSQGDPFDLTLMDCALPGVDAFAVAERIRETESVSDTQLIMLSSVGLRGDGMRSRDLKIDAYLTKPVSASQLLESIQMTYNTRMTQGQLITRHSLRENTPENPDSIRILLAEDNPINQQVATRLLEKCGYRVHVVGDGKQAIKALQEGTFDLVLMDVQMPEMDGLQATAHIRKQELANGTYIPVIALTAHAMEGDRQRCLKAGMDSYVTKPIRPDDLYAVIEEVLSKKDQDRLSA